MSIYPSVDESFDHLHRAGCSADQIGMKQVSERVRGFAQGLVPRRVSPRELHGHARGCPRQAFFWDGPRLSVCRASVETD